MLKLKSQLLLFEKKIVLLGPCLKPTEATVNINGTESNWRNLFFFLVQEFQLKFVLIKFNSNFLSPLCYSKIHQNISIFLQNWWENAHHAALVPEYPSHQGSSVVLSVELPEQHFYSEFACCKQSQGCPSVMAWIHWGVFGLPKSHQNPCARWFLLPGTRSPKTPHWQTRGSGISAPAPEANTGNQKPTPGMPGTYFFPRAQTCGVAVALTTFPVPFSCIGWSPWCCRLPHHCSPALRRPHSCSRQICSLFSETLGYLFVPKDRN